MSQYTCNNALGFERQSVRNVHRDQKTSSCKLQGAPNLHRDKKNKSLELQSAPNLHRDKKKQKNTIYLGGPTIPLKFLFFLFFLSLCRFGARWSSKLLFFVPVQVWSTSSLNVYYFCACGGFDWSGRVQQKRSRRKNKSYESCLWKGGVGPRQEESCWKEEFV